MNSWLSQTAFNIRHSYWFIPSLMALAAIIFAVVMVTLDIYYLQEVPKGYEWLFRSQPSGARAILSTVAGSTITVAGVVFSMTIMAVSHATSNYGSRLLLNFLKDTQNQIALGTFTATFIYCLLVLRTVSDSENASQFNGFVPHLAVLGALGMALASVAVLIAFIHHVPDSIHLGEVASDRGKELINRLDSLFPVETHNIDGKRSFTRPKGYSSAVESSQTGYIQTLDISGLVDYCSEHNLIAEVIKQPGDFVCTKQRILQFDEISPQKADCSHDAMSQFFGIGSERTPAQDVRFMVEELNQIAIRALSPGVNDPYTASTCIDWLGGAIAHIADRQERSSDLYDDERVLRLMLPQFDFTDFCGYVFNQLRPYVVSDSTISLHIAGVFRNIIAITQNEHRRATLNGHATVYMKEALDACSSKKQCSDLKRGFSFTET